MPPQKVAVAWLRKEDWPRWQAIDPDLPPFERWQTKINQGIAAAELRGAEAVKIPVDPHALVQWCTAQGKPIDRSSRSLYAAAVLMRLVSGH